MLKIHVRPVRDLRNHYRELAEIVKNNDQVIITNNGIGEAVLISIDEYALFEEYVHTRYVDAKLAEAADPNSKRLSHEEFWRDFGYEV
jgi:prevent-host-death family protein